MKLNEMLKSVLFILIIIQLIPFVATTIKEQYQTLLGTKVKVAKIEINGTIDKADTYIKQLKKYFTDSDIKAIVLDIDSGGGTAGSAQTIFNEIVHYKKQEKTNKPVVVRVENICASGAYYIACAADKIVASPSAFIGSIGVYIPKPEVKEFIEQYKLHYSVTKTGKYKGINNPLLTNTEEQNALLQGLTDDTYNQFIQDVAQQRSQLPADATIWAQGKLFTGTQALSIGLIDQAGSPSDAEALIKELGGITATIDYVTKEKKSQLMQWLGTESSMHAALSSAVQSWINTQPLPH